MNNLFSCIAFCILILYISENWSMFAFFISVSAIVFLAAERQALDPANRQTNPLRIERYGRKANNIYPKNLMYQLWSPEILFSNRTRENLQMANQEKMRIRFIDQRNGITEIKDASGQSYYTTLTSCTCSEAEHSCRPCKHMLKLAQVTGALDQFDDLTPHDVVYDTDTSNAHE